MSSEISSPSAGDSSPQHLQPQLTLTPQGLQVPAETPAAQGGGRPVPVNLREGSREDPGENLVFFLLLLFRRLFHQTACGEVKSNMNFKLVKSLSLDESELARASSSSSFPPPPSSSFPRSSSFLPDIRKSLQSRQRSRRSDENGVVAAV